MKRLSFILPPLEAIVIVALFMFSVKPLEDGDTFMHLATGRLVASGTLPGVDVYSHTIQGKVWHNHEWLAAWGLYQAYRFSGFPAVAVLGALFAAGTLLAVLGLFNAQEVRSPLARAGALVVAAFFATHNVTPRPHMVTMLFLPVQMNLLLWHRRTGRLLPLGLLPLLFLVWANSHGGFILGALPFLIEGTDALVALRAGIEGARARVKQLACTGAACLVAIAMNPQGIELFLFPFRFAQRPRFLQQVMEWRPLPIGGDDTLWVLFFLTLIAFALWQDFTATDLAALVPVLGLMLQARRSLFLFSIFATPLLARCLARGIAANPRAQSVDAWLARTLAGPRSALVLALVVIASWSHYRKTQFIAVKDFPSAAADWVLHERPPGKMYNGYNQGGFLIWALRDKYPVFIDGRIDTYQEAGFLEDYSLISECLPGWDQLLDRYGVNFVVEECASAIVQRLVVRMDWKPVFAEDGFCVIERTVPIKDR